MIVNPSIVTKSILFGGTYNSATFNADHKMIYGDSFCISGFTLTELAETTPGSGLSLKLSPGAFCSDGVLIQVNNAIEFSYSVSPRTARIVVGYTDSNLETDPVIIDMISPANLTYNMAILGYYHPSTTTNDALTGKDLRGKSVPRYQPASHAKLNELASKVNTGIETESIPGSRVISNSVGSNYRVFSKNIPLAKKDPRLLVFFMGILLEEETHYEIESPGTLIIKGSTSFGSGFIGGSLVSITIDQHYVSAFVDIIFSEDILFREPIVFPANPGNEFKFKVPNNHVTKITSGEAHPILFTRGNSSFSGGTFLSPDRYAMTAVDSGGDPRQGIEVFKRSGWDSPTYANGWVSDEYTGSDMTSGVLTLFGVRGMRGTSTDLRDPNDAPNSVGVSAPIVYRNPQHSTLDSEYVQTSVPFKSNTGELQVFVDGRLCPADHYGANNLSCTASATPTTFGDPGHPLYCNDLNASSYEIGTIPVDNARRYAVSHTSSNIKNISSIFMPTNYLSPKVKEIHRGAANFASLEESVRKPGITEAVFNLQDNRYWDSLGYVSEFYDASTSAFNGNYFVTYESLAGITAGQSSASFSILTTLTTSVTMFYDIPLGFSDALTYSRYLNFAVGSGYFPDTDPLDGDGNSMTNSTTGLYTTVVDPDKYFSKNNPLLTYAGLDAYLQPWMDSLGFVTGTTAPRTYNRNAGVTYDTDGTVLTSFSSLLANRVSLGLDEDVNLAQIIDQVVSNVGNEGVNFGMSYGYAFGGVAINLYTGQFREFETDGVKWPDSTEFVSGMFWGNIGMESPAILGAAANSSAIDTLKAYQNGSNWDDGIMSPIGISPGNIGWRTGTINNIAVNVAPVTGNSQICRYEFCWMSAGDFWVGQSAKQIGIKIFCDNKKIGSRRRRYLTRFFVFGPIDPGVEAALGGKFLSGTNDENWFRMQ